ncbi:MAG: DUF937 domain-containing protein [Cytophagaceae bacterium]|nr:DUF937 domain-containing protein [Cytophagaceae bacterium]
MLEQLMNLVKGHSQEAIVQNPAIPNEHNEEAIQTVTQSIMGGLQNQAQSGNLSGLMGLLTGRAGQGGSLMNNPIVGGIAQNAIGSLMSKFGINSPAASGIVASVLPGVLSSLINKTNDPNDSSVDLNGMMGSLLGGQQREQAASSGINFNQVGAAMADGKLDMNDLMRMGGSLFGGSDKTPGNQQSGGLGGLLGGLFGK